MCIGKPLFFRVCCVCIQRRPCRQLSWRRTPHALGTPHSPEQGALCIGAIIFPEFVVLCNSETFIFFLTPKQSCWSRSFWILFNPKVANGVPVRKLFIYVRYWQRMRVPCACQRAESVKMGDPGQTSKVLQVLFQRDVIEKDPPNRISNWLEGVVLSDNALTCDSIM